LKVFGEEVRRYRALADLSLRDLEVKSSVSDSHLGKIERGKTRCDRKIAEKLDEVLITRGALPALWDQLVRDASFPVWFDWPEIETKAVQLTAYECVVVYGLLQTEAYASSILVNPDDVARRVGRQEILHREEPLPPRLSVLLAEEVLTNEVGGRETMREQCQHLLEVSSGRISVQVVPGPLAPAGTSGAFCLAILGDRSELGYVETPARGYTLSEPADIQTLSDDMADIRARALPVGLSRDHIHRVMEERWT
jgi:transcriptional regulator with XRE-family HTH domain